MIRKTLDKETLDRLYPASDGKPVGETPKHVINLLFLVELLMDWFADEPDVFVAGDMFVYLEEGNRRRHVSPDVFLVRGIPKTTDPERDRYLLWEEKPIDLVIELTSKSTRREDEQVKLPIYRDVVGVQEYFLFDPFDEYLSPSLQGFRRSRGRYVRIKPVEGRLPSEVLGLHLEAADSWLRLFNPDTGTWVQMAPEVRETLVQAEEENERLRRENEELRRRLREMGQE